MLISPPIIDNLWRCLCPAADLPALRHFSRSSRSLNLEEVRKGQEWKLSPHRGRYRLDTRSYAKRTAQDDELDLELSLNEFPTSFTLISTGASPLQKDFARRSNKSPIAPENNSNKIIRLTKAANTQQLYDKLRGHSIRGETEKVFNQVSHLIRYAREKPNKRLYQALIRVNVSRDTGSASKVVSLLKEMDVAGIPLDVEICQDVLAV